MFISDENFQNGDVLTVRFYQNINGTECFMRSLTHNVVATVGGVLVISGNYPIHEQVRCTLQSAPARTVEVPISAGAFNHTLNRTPFE